ncbi:MAG: hypothetical protein J6V14_10970 [Clostridia bacterium]|jgi:DNA-directed RNA polymerase subunit RPC12/RpoP|nr:hypothetical protein [Clostridia bacterium]
MGYLSERVNYVKGLMEGMKFDTNTDEGKLFKALIDIVEDLAISAEDLEDTQDQILDVIDEYEERIDDLEAEVFDEEYYDEDIDEPLTCPECGAELDFDELDIDESVRSFKCPECGTKIDIEWLDDDAVEE